MKSWTLLSLIVMVLALAAADNWAIIISGSEGYYNYRHQSNIAHQYSVYLDYGVKPENIIVFSLNDVAESQYNPFPGELYNLPGDDAREYNKGLVIDYQGKEITKEALFNCLLGIEDGSGKKVLKSTEKDKVFINYYDHGGPDVIVLIKERIKKDELQNVLKKMSAQKMFAEMVFYLEACDSATMMIGFPDDLNIYVVTSTDAAVSGYACFCPPDDIVHGKHIGACLSEEFGYAYMKDLDENGGKDNFQEQFEVLYGSMKLSKPKQWATMSFLNETLAQFFGVDKMIVRPSEAKTPTQYWDTRDNKLLFLANQLSRNDISFSFRSQVIEEYKQEAILREKTDNFFKELVARTVGIDSFDDMMQSVKTVVNTDCYYNAIDDIDRILPMSDYELKYFQVMANICDKTKMRRLPMF